MRILMIALLASVFTVSSCNKASQVTAAPKAEFKTNIEPGKDTKENERIQFTNLSTEGSYFWDFGNGKTSREKEPAISYNIHGPYTISLTVTDAEGQTSVYSEKIIVLCNFQSGVHTSTE